jgi:hyperosmotically inducible protein
MKQTLLFLSAVVTLPLFGFANDDKKNDADNSSKNERDRAHRTLTPADQSARPENVQLTQAIRQAIMKDKSLTMTAKNIKIITADSKVTLRGPVNTAEEKAKINSIAKANAGQVAVDNQLEVKSSH